MSLPTYVSAGFKRALKAEFPYYSLEWDAERGRWGLWETDTRGWRWFDRYIETPAGEYREPGEWLIELLRASKLENQGVERGNPADRKAYIRKLYPHLTNPWVCDTCNFAELDVHGYPGCEKVVIDDRHRRWCRSCLVSKVGWKPLTGKQPIKDNPKLIGLMRRADTEEGEGHEKIRSMPRRVIALPNVMAKE